MSQSEGEKTNYEVDKIRQVLQYGVNGNNKGC